jgi:CRP-like cAMP-binding protein
MAVTPDVILRTVRTTCPEPPRPGGRRGGITRERLAGLALFRDLDEATLEAILAGSRSIFVETRGVLASAGAEVAGVIVVISGRVQLAAETEAGERSILGILGPGTPIGEAALLEEDGAAAGGPAFSVTATAVEDCLCLVIDARVFRHLMETRVRFAAAVARVLAHRIRMLVARDACVTTLDLPLRLARFVLWLAEQEGARAGGELSLRISQEALGELVAATRESVNKHLRDWARLGVVEHVAGRLRIVDLERLRAMAAGG